jgi:phospholipid/cholesterol/gamma-HCH transport system permease protein
VDRWRERDDAAADREHEQGAEDHEATATHVAEQARRHLENGLRQPVGAERESDEERRGAGESRSPGRHDRQRHVQAEHAQRVDAARPENGGELVAQEDGAGGCHVRIVTQAGRRALPGLRAAAMIRPNDRLLARVPRGVRRVSPRSAGPRHLLRSGRKPCVPPPVLPEDTYEQAYNAGVGSLHLTLISSFFAGQALGLQFSRQLAETGSTTLIGMLMTIAVVRALGPDLIGLVVAARLASGYTAEIGAMKSANQIDALVAFGTDPIRKLAVPRFVSLFVHAAGAGHPGRRGRDHGRRHHGALRGARFAQPVLAAGAAQPDVRYAPDRPGQAGGVRLPDLVGRVLEGLHDVGGTRGVGMSTTQSVTICSVMLLIMDFILTRVLFSILHW